MEDNSNSNGQDIQEYKPREKEISSSTDAARNILGAASFGSKFQIISDFGQIFIQNGAWLALPFLRYDLGARAYSPLTILIAGFVLGVVELVSSLYNTIGTFLGGSFDTTLYNLYFKAFVILMIGHGLHIAYRTHIQKRHVHSYYHGHSWGYDMLWKPLVNRFNFRILRDEAEYQYFIEPLFILVGAVVMSYLGSNFSAFLYFASFCLFFRGLAERRVLRNKWLDLKDAAIMNSVLNNKVKDGTEATNTSNGASMFNNRVVLSDIRAIDEAQQGLDESLQELQKLQQL